MLKQARLEGGTELTWSPSGGTLARVDDNWTLAVSYCYVEDDGEYAWPNRRGTLGVTRYEVQQHIETDLAHGEVYNVFTAEESF